MNWDWRADLIANSPKNSLCGVVIAFLLYPSFTVICWLRLMLACQSRGTRVSRIGSRVVFGHILRNYGLNVSVMTKYVGPGFSMPHPTGIVIGDGTSIGRNVVVLQNVTLGRRSKALPGCPDIRDGVQILAGAVILGPVVIGENAVVGANAVVLNDVFPNTTVVGAPARPIR